MTEGDLNNSFTQAQQAAYQARSAAEKAQRLIVKGQRGMAQQGGQQGGEKEVPDPLQSNINQSIN